MRTPNLRQILVTTLLLVLAMVVGYSLKQDTSSIPKIAVLQNKPQEWADAIKLGFSEGLRERGFEIMMIPLSAAGDPQALNNLALTVKKQNYDIVYSLGTQASQTAFNTIKNKPIIFGAVTDPVKTGFYEDTLDKPLGNITGTQDLWPYPAQFDLIMKLFPSLKKLGLVYNSSEVNSQVSVAFIKKECQNRGINLDIKSVTDPSQISLAVSSLITYGIDAFFIPADNTAQGASGIILSMCMEHKVPVFTGIPGIVENGALGTVGTNYFELGKINAAQAIEILKGKQARDISPSIADKGDLYLNLKTAKTLGIQIPKALIDKAFKLYE